MSSGKVLVWLAGDSSGYSEVKYRFSSKEISSIMSPAALNTLYDEEFEEFYVIIPDTLFTDNYAKNYELLLKAKAGCDDMVLYRKTINDFVNETINDSKVSELISGIKEFKNVPHPGVARPLSLRKKNQEVYLEYGSPKTYEAGLEH